MNPAEFFNDKTGKFEALDEKEQKYLENDVQALKEALKEAPSRTYVFPKTTHKVIRKQKIVLKPTNLILSNEELKKVRDGVDYQLNTQDVIFVPEGFDVYIVDQDCVVEVNE